MEKILVALNPCEINTNLVDFACYIAGLTRSGLTGVVLGNGDRCTLPVTVAVEETREVAIAQPAHFASRSQVKLSEDYLSHFEESCRNRGVRCELHYREGDPLKQLAAESRYADLLIVDPEMTLHGGKFGLPIHCLKEILSRSECPVLIAPYAFYGVDEIVLAYDGSASSSFAIKQFAYLFPQLSDFRVNVVHVSDGESDLLAEKKRLGEFLKTHYCSIGYRSFEGKADEELLKYLQQRKNVFLVMGAFGRSGLSELFRPSTAELLLKALNLPIFITHP